MQRGQFGSRCWRKAAIPSCDSSLSRACLWNSNAWAKSCWRSAVSNWRNKRFVCRTAWGPPWRIVAAIARAAAMSCSRGNHPIDQPHAQRPLGIDRLGQQEQFAQIAVAEAPTEHGSGQGRHQPPADLGKADPQIVGRDNEVATGHQAGSARVGRPVNGRDRDQGEVGRRSERPGRRTPHCCSANSACAASSRSSPEQNAGPAPRRSHDAQLGCDANPRGPGTAIPSTRSSARSAAGVD